MYTVAFIMKRKLGMSLENFLAYYEHKHGPRMLELIRNEGLVAYEHYPLNVAVTEGRYISKAGPAFDAISIYTFETEAQAEKCWAFPEVIKDSEAFIDFSTMVTLPVGREQVFPLAKVAE